MTESLHKMVSEFIRRIDPYVPGKPVEEVERELKVQAVKLASNENPLGPSPHAVEAAREALASAHRYPDAGGYYLRQKLAARHDLPMEKVILGLGSSELIDLTARALLEPGREALTSEGSFPLYYICARAAGATLVRVPLSDYRIDLPAMARAITPRTRVVYLANPNNPTGTMFNADEFDAFLAQVPDGVLVVLDEAYCDYVVNNNYSRATEIVRRGRAVMVLRTFSKVHGLAGLRMGYGLGPSNLLGELNKLRTPFNTSSVAQAAALAALDDGEHVQRSVESNRAGLQQLREGLAAMGLHAVPSVTNFVLAELGESATPVSDALLKRGVIVRPMAWMGFPNAIRVSVGTAAENEKFLATLAAVRGARAAK